MRFYPLIIPVAFMIAGCSSAAPTINEYTIYPSASMKPTPVHSPKVLRLASTRTIPSLESKNLIYLHLDGVNGSYLYTRWSDTPSLLIERSLHHSLQEQALFSTILSPTSSARADILLESDLHAFYHRVETGEQSKGVIDISYRLIDVDTKLPIASKRFFITKDAPSEDGIGGIKALSEATKELSEQCSQWIKEKVIK